MTIYYKWRKFLMNVSGIYKILCLQNNKCYIGSAVNIRKRWNSHKSELNNNKHTNQKLQNAWNKYGSNQFQFLIVEKCCKEQLLLLEEKYIKENNSYISGFNLVETPTNNNLGLKHTQLSKVKMSNSAKTRGRNSGSLTNEQVKQIREKFFNNERIINLSKQFDVSRKTITQCVYLKTYTDVECNINGYNEMLKDVLQTRKQGKRPKSSGWKHTTEFIEKFRRCVTGPKLSIRKFTIEQIIDIRNQKNNGRTCRELAEKYNVNQNTISKICRRLIYQDVI